MTRRVLVMCSCLAAFAAACGDDDGPVQPKPKPKPTSVTLGAVKDNTLYEDSAGTWSNGAGNFFFSGRVGLPSAGEIRRGLIAFPVAGGSIAAGSVIDSVFLVLDMNRTIAGATLVRLHRLVADWGEGASKALGNEGGGDFSSGGDATWIHTFYDTAFWASRGGDFAADTSASVAVAAEGSYTWGSTARMVADVQGWLDSPSSNYGWIVIGDESQPATSKRFASRTHPTAAVRPKLVVHFTSP